MVARILLLLVIAVILVIIFTAYGQIRLNRWNKPFYDALSRRDLHDFLLQLGIFFIIAFGLLVLNVAQRWLVEMLKLRMRQAIVNDLLRDWMLPHFYFHVVTAYDILRHNGVEIGKFDYLNHAGSAIRKRDALRKAG